MKYINSKYSLFLRESVRQTRSCSRALSVANTRTRRFSHYGGSPWKREVNKVRGGDAATPIAFPLRKTWFR